MTPNPTPIRILVLLSLGPSFGGFRLAVHPRVLGLHNAEPFTVIESWLRATFSRIERVPADQWSRLGEELASDPHLGSLSPRAGFIDFHRSDDPDGTRHLVARGFLPFRLWPLGGWAVYDGRHFASGGAATPYTTEELQVVW